MKRMVAGILALLMLLSMTACNRERMITAEEIVEIFEDAGYESVNEHLEGVSDYLGFENRKYDVSIALKVEQCKDPDEAKEMFQEYYSRYEAFGVYMTDTGRSSKIVLFNGLSGENDSHPVLIFVGKTFLMGGIRLSEDTPDRSRKKALSVLEEIYK